MAEDADDGDPETHDGEREPTDPERDETPGDEEAADQGDPFADLAEDVADREGDPFETLAGADEADQPPGESADSSSAPAESDADGHEAATANDPTVTGRTDPFADLHGEEAGSGEDQAAGGAGPDSAGGRGPDSAEGQADSAADVGTPGADVPGVGDGAPGSETGVAGAGDREGDPFEAAESAFEEMDVGDLDPDQVWEELDDAEARGSVSEARERTYAEVSKHAYCEGCEWFSGPPEVSCSHEGTEILEFVDLETVRVVDCPIVAERRQLQEGE